MAEENIWKKQAQLNKMKAEGKMDSPSANNNAGSPINSYLKNSNNTSSPPPWAKNTQPSTSSPQPPWIKTTTSPPETTPAQPSWANKTNNAINNNSSTQNQANNKPAWVKNSPTASSQPSWMKNNSQTEQSSKGEETKNQPAWMKNNQQSGNQPSWIKQPNNEGANKPSQSVNQPSWIKNANQGPGIAKPSETGTPPPWAKKINENQGQPERNSGSQRFSGKLGSIEPVQTTLPWVKKGLQSPPSPGSDSNSPGWVKRDSPQVQRNSWKVKQSLDIERQKKQLEDEIRRQEEQQRERKRLQKQQRQKEEEERNMARELEFMIKEDECSRTREQFDKEEQIRKEREKREEEQRKRLEEQRERQRLEQEQRKRKEAQQLEREREKQAEFEKNAKSDQEKRSRKSLSSRRKKKDFQSSKISHISSIQGIENLNMAASDRDPSLPENIYHKYLRLINDENMEYDYKKKIEIQKAFYQLQLECRKDCQTELVNLLSSKKVTSRKRRIIYSNNMQIQYALCEGKQGESGVQFDGSEVQGLRARFLHYQLLTKCVLSLMKKKINVHLRVPLMNYGEYKGVSFLIEHVCQELVDIIEIEVGLFQEIANEVLVFQKELQLTCEGQTELKPITKDQLMVKKISIYGQDYYILYLKGEMKSSKDKSANHSGNLLKIMPNFTHLNDLSLLQYLMAQSSILPYYQAPFDVSKQTYSQLQKVASPALKKILQSICLAKSINTVYSSCQGEVDEQSFINLVLDGNRQIWDMIVAAGSPDRTLPGPIVLVYFEKLSSVKFNFSPGMNSRKKQLIKSVKPTVFIQRYDYELLEFTKNLQKYIAQDKQELVEQSLLLSRQLWEDIRQEESKRQFNFLQLKNEVNYLLYKQKEMEAIEMIQKSREQIGKLSIESIPLHLLSLKVYIARDMEIPLLKTLSEMLPTLQYYFGEESMIHALIYTAVGNYYSKKIEEPEETRSQKVVTFYEHALSIVLKLYGQKSQEVADIYLSRAASFINLSQYERFHKDIEQAMRIYKMRSKSGPKIAECNHLMGRVRCLQGDIKEGLELMELSSNQYMKMYSHIQSLHILFQVLPFLQNKENEFQAKIESIVEICFTYKSIWAFKRIATLILDRELNCYTSLTIQNLQELFHPLEAEDRTNEEVLIDLEEQIKGFTSFIEIVRWALSIIAGKLASRRQATGDYQKAHSIIHQVFHFYGKVQGISMQLKDSQLL